MKITTDFVENKIIDFLFHSNYQCGDRVYNQNIWEAVFGSVFRSDKNNKEIDVFESTIETLPDKFPELFSILYRFYPDIEYEDAVEVTSDEASYYHEERKLVDKNTGEIISNESSEIYRDIIIL